ncbi:calcium-binding protein [Methylovulum miyakonense]|uniref:calcium-binding protein n=1 Tax=Methylovulum miyakonense TaxID=645578 RepID=UPI00036780AC|nr:calcium-binding protein [Methylovulum miyakonense]
MAIYKGDNTNNTITGSINADFIYGYAGNDKLIGLGGADYIDGGDGNDGLEGGEGNDTLIGGNGADYADYSSATNGITANLTMGKAFGQGLDTLKTIEDIEGSQFDDTLTGDGGANALYGNDGTDKLFGLDGNDTLYGGDAEDNSHDILHGGNGNDILYGGEGSDTLYGDDGNDIMYGGFLFDLAGNNVLYGGKGNDTLYGGDGFGVGKNDRLYGGEGDDILNDIFSNSFSRCTLIGGDGKDIFSGGFNKDNIILTETIAATDTVIINLQDSLLKVFNPFVGKYVNSVDTITGFTLSNGVITKGADQLDIQSINIAANTTGVDGVNAGIIRSHAIKNGIISFDDANTYSSALDLTAENLGGVFKYLQNNFGKGETFAFTAAGNTYLYQDDGSFHEASIIPDNDMVVQLNGVTATNLNTNGLAAGGIWLV